MKECSKDSPWGYHPELRGDHCPRCGFEARERKDFPALRYRRSESPAWRGWTVRAA